MRLHSAGELIPANGERRSIEVWIGDPVQEAHGNRDWVCPCGIVGIRTLPSAYGVEPIQAVVLAYRQVRAVLEGELLSGGRLIKFGEPCPTAAEFLGDSL